MSSVDIIVSSGHVDDAPLIFVGYYPEGSDEYKWTGYFMEHGHIGGYVNLPMDDHQLILDDIQASHHSPDERHTKVYVLRRKGFSSAHLAIYAVDRSEWYHRRYIPIHTLNIFQHDIALEKVFNHSIVDNLYTDGGKLGCTPSGRPFFITRALSVTYDSSQKTGIITLDCAILTENDIWDVFSLRVLDPNRSHPSYASYNTIFNFVVTTTDKTVIISDDAGYAMPMLEGRQIIVDVNNRKAWFEYFAKVGNDIPFQNISANRIRSAWKKHRPFVTSQRPPYAHYVTHRALVPSSRDGFWTDLEGDRRDNSDPYDVVNWETVNRRGLVV